MSARAKLNYFLHTALGSMWRSPFVHVIAISSLSLALLGFGAARIASVQLQSLINSLGGEVELTVYLAPDAPEERVVELRAALTERTHAMTQLISPAEALGRLTQQLGEQADALEDLGDNPLPWSIELKVPPDARDPALLKKLAESTRTLPFVTGVDYGEAAIERLTTIGNAFEFAGIFIFAVVFLTAVIIVSATLQLAIFSRREEIEIQKLVGGTDRFVRMPFLIEGFIQGLVSGLVATGVLWGLIRYIEHDPSSAFGLLKVGSSFAVDWERMALELCGIGIGLGLVGSFVAVRRFLRV